MASLALTGDIELQRKVRSLMSSGTKGKAIFRKGLRAGGKVIAARLKATYPRKAGTAARSVKVKALKRKKYRIGIRVSLYAENRGFPYPIGLEGGVKHQPRGGRVRKAVKKVSVGGVRQRVTDEEGSKAYHALGWRIFPRHHVRNAFEASQHEAQQAMEQAFVEELERQATAP